MRRLTSGIAFAAVIAVAAAFAAAPAPAAKHARKKPAFHACKAPTAPIQGTDENGNHLHFAPSDITARGAFKCARARTVVVGYIQSDQCAPDCTIAKLSCSFRAAAERYSCRRPKHGDVVRFQIADDGS